MINHVSAPLPSVQICSIDYYLNGDGAAKRRPVIKGPRQAAARDSRVMSTRSSSVRQPRLAPTWLTWNCLVGMTGTGVIMMS